MRLLTALCFNLSETFFQLHAKGLCYRDISHNNIFFNPSNGDIMVCDCDNIGVTGASYSGITGTSGYSAPEIERQEAQPSADTDLYSLAVLMFKLLTLGHPLEGKKETAIKCFDIPARKKLYGYEPVFIFDPNNDTNRPDPNYHQAALNHWHIYPKFIQELFIKAFTDGLKPNRRVAESVWKMEMARLRDSIVYCHCGMENFYDIDAMKASAHTGHCWACKKPLTLPPRLRIGKKYIVMLNHDAQLYPHHIDSTKRYDFTKPAAQVVQHPQNPSLWGIKNLSSDKWTIVLPNNTMKEALTGQSAPIAEGVKINFVNLEGEIKL
jgi:serine/threonine protein kinase